MGLMDTVAVVIASPGTTDLDGVVDKIKRITGAASCRWLGFGEACEFDIEAPAFGLEQEIRALISGSPVDVAILPFAGRRKRLLIADMDSTMTAQECIDELAIVAGVGKHVSDITARAMRGELDFEASVRERLSLMKGLDFGVIEKLVAATRYTAGGRTLVQTMKAHGAYTTLVSGGFLPFTAHVAAVLGFDEHRANDLIIAQGKLTGRAREPILGRDAKIAALKELIQWLNLNPGETLAIGDGANDIDMLEAAGLGVAFHAKPLVRERAAVRIDHADLTSLLYLQGYTKAEFVD
jgi:phosphoserine phosphatase